MSTLSSLLRSSEELIVMSYLISLETGLQALIISRGLTVWHNPSALSLSVYLSYTLSFLLSSFVYFSLCLSVSLAVSLSVRPSVCLCSITSSFKQELEQFPVAALPCFAFPCVCVRACVRVFYALACVSVPDPSSGQRNALPAERFTTAGCYCPLYSRLGVSPHISTPCVVVRWSASYVAACQGVACVVLLFIWKPHVCAQLSFDRRPAVKLFQSWIDVWWASVIGHIQYM